MCNVYIAIDLKSFYASVECAFRGLNPMTTNLVVSDNSSTDKSICLAVSPSLKSFGIGGRPRLFEVIKKVKDINGERKTALEGKDFVAKSYDINEINSNMNIEVDFIIAPPQMRKYIEVSGEIYNVYLKWVSKEDIHVYSIDEVFIDATKYLKTYKMTGDEMAKAIILDVLEKTNITATAGVGSNLYLSKVAMDIVAKHKDADEYGVRVANIDEISYREKLWKHQPITDFWRVGSGYKKRLEKLGIYTMQDIARMSILNEDILYKTFGINAELLIDHAWGYEPTRISDIKSYIPKSRGISSGQMLYTPYYYDNARVVVIEMAENMALELKAKRVKTSQVYLNISYDRENLNDEDIRIKYKGEIKSDFYGRMVPKSSKGLYNFGYYTYSTMDIIRGILDIFERVVDRNLLIRKISMSSTNIIHESKIIQQTKQLDIFKTIYSMDNQEIYDLESIKKEERLQETILNIKRRYGKNSILKGNNLLEGATGIKRNNQIGGHRA